jgi:hypothetical protein
MAVASEVGGSRRPATTGVTAIDVYCWMEADKDCRDGNTETATDNCRWDGRKKWRGEEGRTRSSQADPFYSIPTILVVAALFCNVSPFNLITHIDDHHN